MEVFIVCGLIVLSGLVGYLIGAHSLDSSVKLLGATLELNFMTKADLQYINEKLRGGDFNIILNAPDEKMQEMREFLKDRAVPTGQHFMTHKPDASMPDEPEGNQIVIDLAPGKHLSEKAIDKLGKLVEKLATEDKPEPHRFGFFKIPQNAVVRFESQLPLWYEPDDSFVETDKARTKL